ncbi:hypothetical protein K456DRAFT_543556 [Colletotrichum gloeosporioides 23]|nr:hypothetical protein K456DRAFT_543556 [Colletotrichum gloeosporioides 23]
MSLMQATSFPTGRNAGITPSPNIWNRTLPQRPATSSSNLTTALHTSHTSSPSSQLQTNTSPSPQTASPNIQSVMCPTQPTAPDHSNPLGPRTCNSRQHPPFPFPGGSPNRHSVISPILQTDMAFDVLKLFKKGQPASQPRSKAQAVGRQHESDIATMRCNPVPIQPAQRAF